ncbi:MAG TPA: hydrogenase maturation protease [Caldisericia bacterium]|nr:hydrogenase maturation protease [Caldisericia bacterium]
MLNPLVESQVYEIEMLVIGLGNTLLKDEGIGVHVVNALRNHPLPSGVELIDGATMGVDLLNYILDSDRVIIVDAAKMGLKPGEYRNFGLSEIDMDNVPSLSLHDLSLPETLALGQIIAGLPPMVIIGIEPETIDPGDDLSAPLKSSFTNIVSHVYDTILNFSEEVVN